MSESGPMTGTRAESGALTGTRAESGALTGTRAARAAETEVALKEAAIRVFGRVGYLRAKITDITAEAGRAAGSFYSHFDSKEQLLEALLVDMLEAGDRSAEQSGHNPDFSDFEAVRWHIAQLWALLTTNGAVIVALQQAAIVNEHFARRQQELMAPMFEDMAAHLDYVTAAGGHLPGDRMAVATAMVMLMSQYAYAWLEGWPQSSGPRPTADEAVDMLASFILNGIMGPIPPSRAATS
jgi:AcrR family transcriptional regulator